MLRRAHFLVSPHEPVRERARRLLLSRQRDADLLRSHPVMRRTLVPVLQQLLQLPDAEHDGEVLQ